MDAGPVTPLSDTADEGRRMMAAAREDAVAVRLIGGVAFELHKHGPVPPALQRTYADIDVVVRKGHDVRLKVFLAKLGYEPDLLFNRLHGYHRLLFMDPTNGRQLDVFIGRFVMCHALDLDDRLGLDPATLAPADLLLTKLQIVELNAKDVVDAILLLHQHDLAEARAADVIDTGRLVDVTRHDWGWYTTVTDNLARLRDLALPLLSPDEAAAMTTKLAALVDVLERAPKTLQWRARAAAGRRVPWFDLPEERAR
jgi:hypothetical protein